MSKAVTPWYLDKTLYVTVASLFLPFVEAKLGIQLDPLKVAGAFLVVATYVASSKGKSKAVLLKELELKALDIAQAKLGPDAPPAKLGTYLGATGSVSKALALALVVGVGLVGAPASAQTLVSAGPTVPLIEVRPGTHPVSLAPGAGMQLSFTWPQFQKAINGRAWDLLDVNVMAFGTAINSAGAPTFGALSAAMGVCTLSSLFCVGGGHDIVASGGLKPDWFAVFAFSLNFAGSPASPPAGTEHGTLGMLRGNTLYFGGW